MEDYTSLKKGGIDWRGRGAAGGLINRSDHTAGIFILSLGIFFSVWHISDSLRPSGTQLLSGGFDWSP